MLQLSSKKLFGNYVKEFFLFLHQISVVEWMRLIEFWIGYINVFKGGVIADDMGFGKTRTSSALIAANIVPFTLVICPPSTRYNWIEELLQCNDRVHIFTIEGDKYIHCTLVTLPDGTVEVQDKPLNKSKGQKIVAPCVLVCNYQLISVGTKNNKLVTDYQWDRIIVDEAHFLRNDTTTWSKINALEQPMTMTNGIQHRLGSRWCLSGTPIQMGKGDLVNIFKFCDDRFLRGTSEREWGEELKWLISTRLFRRNRDQLTPYMKKMMRFPVNDPEIRIININVPDTQLSQYISQMSYEQLVYECTMDHNNRMKGFVPGISLIDAILLDEKAFLITLTSEAKYTNKHSSSGSFIESEQLRKMISYPYNTVPMLFERLRPGMNEYKGKMSKLDFVKDVLFENIGKQFVIFHHYEMIAIKIEEMIKASFPRTEVFKINGNVKSDRERYNIVKRCNALIKQGLPVVLLSSMMATSEGVNYQEFPLMITLDPEYNPKTQDQANSRVNRIGQVNDVVIYEMYLNDFQGFYGNVSVDNRIKDIRDERKHISDIIDDHNAAWTFKRPSFRNPNGVVETGICFDPAFESLPSGTLNGPNSFGPNWIKSYDEMNA